MIAIRKQHESYGGVTINPSRGFITPGKSLVNLKRTASNDLTELVDKYNLLEKSDAGAGTYYHE